MKPIKTILRQKTIALSALLLFLLVSSTQLKAKVILQPCFSDNMVLQQKSDVSIWGYADPDKDVSVITSWNQKRYTVKTTTDGKWSLKVSTPTAGGPYAVNISDGELLSLKNVLIGDVWICSGQSNMEMPVKGWDGAPILNSKEEIANANYPMVRFLQVERNASTRPVDSFKASGGWQVCSPSTVGAFSATAYFFGRDLFKDKHTPIGLIHTSWGGTIAEAWVSPESLKTMPDFTDSVSKIQASASIQSIEKNRANVLYNGMIYPLIHYAIKGAIWYQGEANVGRALQYQKLLPLLIADWRQQWGQGNFPFLFVQLANFLHVKDQPTESKWAELREAQLKTCSVPNTGMAVIIDIGEGGNIHPKNKEEVGRRLALIARAKVFNESISYSGPVYKGMTKKDGNTIRLTFENAGEGLISKNSDTLKGFAVAGSDHVFHWAKAEIKGQSIQVSSPEVQDPAAVRYAWADNPVCNLYSKAGLPASPFRTDDWEAPADVKK